LSREADRVRGNLRGRAHLTKYQFTRRKTQGVVGFLYPQLCMLGAVIDHDIDDDPATTAAATAGAIHLVCVNYAPWTTRAPILHELVQWIAGIFIRMLFPLRIGKVDSVGSVVIFVFESRE